MPPTSSTPPGDEARDAAADASPAETSPLEDMERADTANGENPDVGAPQPEPSPAPAEGESAHPTGERQARANRESDPPA